MWNSIWLFLHRLGRFKRKVISLLYWLFKEKLIQIRKFTVRQFIIVLSLVYYILIHTNWNSASLISYQVFTRYRCQLVYNHQSSIIFLKRKLKTIRPDLTRVGSWFRNVARGWGLISLGEGWTNEVRVSFFWRRFEWGEVHPSIWWYIKLFLIKVV